MPQHDEATLAATDEILAALDRQLTGPADHGSVGVRGPVVAAAPDHALDGARREIVAALNGEPTPGAL